LIEDLRERQLKEASETTDGESNGLTAEEPSVRVLCVPVRDPADATAAMMLGQILSGEGFATEVGSLDSLVSDTIAWVTARPCDIAVLVVLPPLGSRHCRYLCKRLRQSKPSLHIVAALLNGEGLKNTRQRLEDSGADAVVTSLSEAIETVRAYHPPIHA
jgi:DNA-binding response OmpR family regulator